MHRTTFWTWVWRRAAIAGLLAAIALSSVGCARTVHANTAPLHSDGLVDADLGETQPPNARTLYAMARLWRAQDKDQYAEIALQNLVHDFPEFSPSYNELADIRIKQGRFEEAGGFLERGLEVAPNDPVLLNNAAVCALLRRDPEHALPYFKRASVLAPFKPRYRANVALAMGMNGHHEEARVLFAEFLPAEDAEFNTELIRAMMNPPLIEQEFLLQLFEPLEIDIMLD